MRDTLGVLLAGGAGERLFPSDARSCQAGRTLRRSVSHHRHHALQLHQLRPASRLHPDPVQGAIAESPHPRGLGAGVANELGEFIEILPPMQRVSKNWYTGTADAVYQNIYSIGAEEPKYVIILSGDHIYKMNYGLMIQQHRESGADVTLATLPIKPEEVSSFGVVEVARNGEVTGFEEKPKETKMRSPFMPGHGRRIHGHLHLQHRCPAS